MKKHEAGKELAMIEGGLTFEQMQKRAELLVKSGFLPKAIKTAEQAIAIMLMGSEYGIPPMKSFQSIHIIEGKPSLSSQLMLALCERTGELEDKKFEEHDTYAAVELKRKGQTAYRATFGDKDAQTMKTKESVYDNFGKYTGSKTIPLIEKYNYKTMKKDMYMARAISRACRRLFPDAVLGLYVVEEAYDVIDIGSEARIDAEAVVAKETADKSAQLTAPIEAVAGTPQEQVEKDELFMKLSASFIQDEKFYSFYPDKTLGEIYADKTACGKQKGKAFLEKVMNESSKPVDKANIEQFLNLIAEEPVK